MPASQPKPAPEYGPAATVNLRNTAGGRLPIQARTLEALCARIVRGERIAQPVEVDVLVCTSGAIAELNSQYRDKPEPTDVLSFDAQGPSPAGVRVLGDIAISLDAVRAVAGEDRPSMRDEICMLFCHGVLHLLGYRHDTAAQEAPMAAKQAAYLAWEREAAWFGAHRHQKAAPKTPAHS